MTTAAKPCQEEKGTSLGCAIASSTVEISVPYSDGHASVEHITAYVCIFRSTPLHALIPCLLIFLECYRSLL